MCVRLHTYSYNIFYQVKNKTKNKTTANKQPPHHSKGVVAFIFAMGARDSHVSTVETPRQLHAGLNFFYYNNLTNIWTN